MRLAWTTFHILLYGFSYDLQLRCGVQFHASLIGVCGIMMDRQALQIRLKLLLADERTKEFVRFAIVGVIATGIHYGVYYLFERIINVNVAYTIGYVVSWFANLYLTSRFTFKSQLSIKKGVGFAFSHMVNYLLHMLFLNMFLAIGLSPEIAPLFVFALVIPINFLLVRFVFKSKRFAK